LKEKRSMPGLGETDRCSVPYRDLPSQFCDITDR
jgi:hypothetical protein